jgi:hypothetical protein
MHATDDNMAHAHCILDNKGYRHTLHMQYLMLFHESNGHVTMP